MRARASLLLLLCACSPAPTRAADVHHPGPLFRMAALSCHRTGPSSDAAFARVAASSPDLLVLLGDNIYADTRDPLVLRRKYEEFNAIPSWDKLRGSCHILPVWDDHDYGENDAGADFPMRSESTAIFRDAFAIPPDHPMRAREGIYHSATFGPPGRRTQVILLDTRSFRSPLSKSTTGSGYTPDPNPAHTMLGKSQWDWLEQQLREPAELRIIGSSIQVIPEEHRFEKWANFPGERRRLLDFLAAADGLVLLLSGDRHMAEFSRISHEGKSLVELTTSGLTHAGAGRVQNRDEPNQHRLGAIFNRPNSALLRVDWQPGGPHVGLHILGPDGNPAAALEITPPRP